MPPCAADFPGLSLKGAQNATFTLNFTLTGPQLFGSGFPDSRVVSRDVRIAMCEAVETFDAVTQLCGCASGFGSASSSGSGSGPAPVRW